jgi:hypothetical protein
MIITLILSIIINHYRQVSEPRVCITHSFLPVFRLGLSLLYVLSIHPSPNPRHITNLTESSNRTIDYLTESAAKPEAYQAHYRRISATKAANQKQQEKDEKEIALRKHQEATYADLFGFSVDFSARYPKYNGPHPASAPAAFNSTNGHATVLQGEIPIGLEPPLSPLRDMELGC